MNQVEEQLGTTQDLMNAVQRQGDELAEAFAADRMLYKRREEALQALEAEENMILVGLDMQAQDKNGPLAGVAKTSKMYDVILKAERDRARKEELYGLYSEYVRLDGALTQASIELEQAKTRFLATRTACELLASANRLMAGN